MAEPWICNAAWNSITFFPNGKIAPCCQYHMNQHQDLATVNGQDTFKGIQDQMMAGEVPAGCDICQIREAKGQQSYRMFYGDKPELRQHIRHIDLRNSNFCNLACRMCNAASSSTWAKILNQGFITNTSVFEYIDPLLTEHLADVYITGGEPFMNPDHWIMLEKLIESGLAKNVNLRYNTNLTTLRYKNQHVEDYWKHFKSVYVLSSIEAVGEPLEYIRSKANWSVVDRNITELMGLRDKYHNITLHVNSTVSALNVWFLPELISYCEKRAIPIQFIELLAPEYLNIVNLPVQHRLQAIELLKNINDPSQEIRAMITNTDLTDQRDTFEKMIAHVLLLDKINGEKLFDLLPFRELAMSRIITM